MDSVKVESQVDQIQVLHVDDDMAQLDIAKQILIDLNSNLAVESVTTVEEAFTKLSANSYDIILSDYEMPQKNGLDFLRELRKQKINIPFILFTGKGREEVAIQALNLGADGYYNKQGSPETVYGELIHGIETIYERRQIKQALEESERRYSALMEQATVAIFVHDTKGRIIDVNQRACKNLGYSKEEIVSMTITDIDNTAVEKIALWPKVLSGETFTFESINKRKDGSIFHVEVSIGPIKIGKETLVMGLLRDITERKKIETSLRESQRRYQDLIETTGEFIWEMDSRGRYTYCSPQMEQLWGIKPEKMIGKTPFDVMPAEYRDRALEAFLSFGQSPVPFKNLESIAFDGQGRLITIEINGRPFFDDQGKLLGFRGITRDITERKTNEENQSIFLKKLQKANEKLQVVGSLTRHDVTNKLSSIRAQTYLIKKKFGDNPELVKAIGGIELAVEQSDRLFEFSRLYERIGAEALSPVNVWESFNQAKDLLSIVSVEIVNNCHGLTVSADSLLRQVFYNLIDNSLKHGKKITQINLDYRKDESAIILIYQDNGVGIPLEAKDKIFEAGFSTSGGSGLGLQLVKKIIEEYGWSIKETGIPGLGAKYEIMIPLNEYKVPLPKVNSIEDMSV